MTVHNVRIKVKERHNFKHALREESKSFAVVIITVTAGTLEIKFVVYEVERYSTKAQKVKEVNTEKKKILFVASESTPFIVLPLYVGIKRNYYSYIVSARGSKRLR